MDGSFQQSRVYVEGAEVKKPDPNQNGVVRAVTEVMTVRGEVIMVTCRKDDVGEASKISFQYDGAISQSKTNPKLA